VPGLGIRLVGLCCSERSLPFKDSCPRVGQVEFSKPLAKPHAIAFLDLQREQAAGHPGPHGHTVRGLNDPSQLDPAADWTDLGLNHFRWKEGERWRTFVPFVRLFASLSKNRKENDCKACDNDQNEDASTRQ
jgi:hypothetical protein